MESLSPAIRALLVDARRADDLDSLRERAETAKLASIVPVKFSPRAKIPVKVRVLQQAALRRMLDIVDAFVRDANAGSLVPIYLASRAALETALLVLDIGERVEEAIRADDPARLPELDERIMKAMLGVKSGDWGNKEEIEAVNVVTLIERYGKRFGVGISIDYSGLSEHAHPNFAGVVGGYSESNESTGEITFFDRPLIAPGREHKVTFPLNWVAGSLELLLYSVDAYELRLEAFVKVCERGLAE